MRSRYAAMPNDPRFRERFLNKRKFHVLFSSYQGWEYLALEQLRLEEFLRFLDRKICSTAKTPIGNGDPDVKK